MSQAINITDNDAPPDETDVVIVGAGISGVAAAISLRSQGLRVAVCEKGVVAGEQSSRALGWVSSLGDPAGRLELSSCSKDIWMSYSAKLGVDTTYRRSGVAILCYSEREMEQFDTWHRTASGLAQTDARTLTRAELVKRLGVQPPPKVVGGYCQPSDGGIDPRMATPLLASAAQQLGVTIHEQCAVRGLETSAGSVSGVVTERGLIRAKAVIVAAGVWSRLFCGNLGIDLPIASVYATTARLKTSPSRSIGSGATDSFGWQEHPDGTCTFGVNRGTLSIVPDSFRLLPRFLPSYLKNRAQIKLDFDQDFFRAWGRPRRWPLDAASPFEAQRVLTSQPDDEGTMHAFSAFLEFFGKSSAQIVESWGSVMDSTPDRIPIIGPVTAIPGLYVCTGFSAHGLAMGPAAGQLVASQILGRPGPVPSEPYQLSRFSKEWAGTTVRLLGE